MLRDTTFTDAACNLTVDEAEASFVMDEDTFRAFYDRTARSLWAYLARVTNDPHQADDLLQETYFRFLRSTADYEGESHRRHSLFRIATNLARDAHRRSRVRAPFSSGGEEIERLPGADHAGAAERRTDFHRAMAQLNPRERAILWLAYAEGATHREIAGALGLHPASLKVMLFRARRRLAALLGGKP